MDDNKFWLVFWAIAAIALCIGGTTLRGCMVEHENIKASNAVTLNQQNTERDKAYAAAGLVQKQEVNGVILWVKP